jgi:uncharacterized membrane protein YeaQ/YmgE (transglycosylase-associated protein family)
MEYVWMAVIGLAIGLVMGQFLQGNNFGVTGDMLFAISGALVFAVLLGLSGAMPEAGPAGKGVIAAIGAFAALFLRRVLRVV